MMVLAFDPGIEGAYAWHYGPGVTPLVDDLPVMGKGASRQLNVAELSADLRSLIRTHGRPVTAVIEAVHSMPKQGVSTTFKFGQALGSLHGICAALEIPILTVAPSAWKGAMKLDNEGETSRLKALRRWPGLNQALKFKKDHNKAEAALLGAWFYEHSPQARGQHAMAVAKRLTRKNLSEML
jgi:crossover junction endodeoxyribonuclease RuvC